MKSSAVFDQEINSSSVNEVLRGLISLRSDILALESQESVKLKQNFNSKVLEFYQYRHFMWLRSTSPVFLQDLRELYGLDQELDEGEYDRQFAGFWHQAVKGTTGDEHKLYILM
jgi:hypothetical protein